MRAVRYEDLVREPGLVLRDVFRYAGLPESAVTTAVQAFGKDSQDGSFLSRNAVESQESVEIQERE